MMDSLFPCKLFFSSLSTLSLPQMCISISESLCSTSHCCWLSLYVMEAFSVSGLCRRFRRRVISCNKISWDWSPTPRWLLRDEVLPARWWGETMAVVVPTWYIDWLAPGCWGPVESMPAPEPAGPELALMLPLPRVIWVGGGWVW